MRGFITAMRTGAASGVATKYLARKDSTTLGIFGAGTQAKTQAIAICAVRNIKTIKVYDIEKARSKSYCREMSKVLNIKVLSCRNAKEVVNGCDILCTATTSKTPVFKGEWLNPGIHINGIGSFTPTTRELDEVVIMRSKLIVDSKEAALREAGDIILPITNGLITSSHIYAEIGEIVAGLKRGRINEMEITIFKSVGLALQDVATALLAYKKAGDLSLGQSLNI